MPERVPADLADACPQRCRLQLARENGFLPARSARIIGEDPVTGSLVVTSLMKFLQVLRQSVIE